jgi:hypothetical protein
MIADGGAALSAARALGAIRCRKSSAQAGGRNLRRIGVVYGLRALDACRDLGVESHLIMSRAAALTLAQETELSVADVQARADVTYKVADVGAAVASGSFRRWA